MTGEDVRALCLALPETAEKETWGDADEPGHATFRIRDKIYVIMAVDGTSGSVRTSMDEQDALVSAFPDGASVAAYVGRYGWVDLVFARIPDDLLRQTIEGAWARTAPKKVAAAWRDGR